MGSYNSIDDLQNDPELERMIREAIDSIFTMEDRYHEEVKEVSKQSVTSTQAASNNIKGMIVAGPGTTIALKQSNKLETIMKTSYYSNILSASNGKPEVKLIASDMLKITSKNNADKEMPNFYDPTYIMNSLGYDVSAAEFDFDSQVIRYKIAAEEEKLTNAETKRQNDLKQEMEEREESGRPSLENELSQLKSDVNVIKSDRNQLETEYTSLNSELMQRNTDLMTSKANPDILSNMNKYNQVMARYVELNSNHNKSNEAYNKQLNQKYADEDKSIHKSWDDEQKEFEKKWQELDDKYMKDNNGKRPDNKTKYKEELDIHMKHYTQLIPIITSRTESEINDLNTFEQSLVDDKDVTDDPNTTDKDESHEGFNTLLTKCNSDLIAKYNWNIYVRDHRLKYIRNQLDIVSSSLINILIGSIKYSIDYNTLTDELTNIINSCFNFTPDPSHITTLLVGFIEKNYMIDELRRSFINLTTPLIKASVYHKSFISTITECNSIINQTKQLSEELRNNKSGNSFGALLKVLTVKSVIPEKMWVSQSKTDDLNLTVKRLNSIVFAMKNAERSVLNEINRIEALLTPLIPTDDDTNQVDQSSSKYPPSQGWRTMTFKHLYDVLTSGFKANISEKITNINEKITNITTNIDISTRNVASNNLRIKAVNVTDSFININQFNESRVQLIADFNMIADKLSGLPNKSNELPQLIPERVIQTVPQININTSSITDNHESQNDSELTHDESTVTTNSQTNWSTVIWIIIGIIILGCVAVCVWIMIVKRKHNKSSDKSIDQTNMTNNHTKSFSTINTEGMLDIS